MDGCMAGFFSVFGALAGFHPTLRFWTQKAYMYMYYSTTCRGGPLGNGADQKLVLKIGATLKVTKRQEIN